MNRVLFVLAAIMIGAGSSAFAQDTSQTTTTTTNPPMILGMPESSNPWQASVQGGGLWSMKDKSRLHDGAAVLGRLTYDVTENVAVGAESGGLRFEDRSASTRYGYLDGVPAMADVVLKMPIAATGNRLVPYVYGGAGVIFWSYQKSAFSDASGVDARNHAHWAAKPGGGLEYYLTPHISIFAEVSYLFSRKYELKNGNSTPPDGKVNVDALYGGGGIKIAF